MKWIMMSLLALFLAGCSSLSEKECQQGNWESIGEKDGRFGSAEDRFASHQKACGEFGINPDKNQWMTGYKRGLKSFCAKEGTRYGKEGKIDQTARQCHDSAEFIAARKQGFQEYCHHQGKSAGAEADWSHGASSCHKLASYKSGYNDGLAAYCTYDKGRHFGVNAADHRGRNCRGALKTAFYKGWNSGITEYCQRKNAFQMGQTGAATRGDRCPSKMRNDFNMAYSKGKEYQVLKNKMGQLDGKIAELNTKIQNPETSEDLREYLTREKIQVEAERKVAEKETYKIEGFVGL